MGMTTSTSLSGFIASTPATTIMGNGEPRTYMRIGQTHYTRDGDGTFTQTESTYHDLVLFRGTGNRAADMFRKGDTFIAEGYVHTYQTPSPDGTLEEREEFVARKIGHDTARTPYTVDRTPRTHHTPTTIDPVPANATVDTAISL